MPTTLNDPRPRTRSVTIDCSNPVRYMVRIVREAVQEDSSTGKVLARKVNRVVTRTVTFDADGAPVGDPHVIALLGPITAAIEACEAADLAAT